MLDKKKGDAEQEQAKKKNNFFWDGNGKIWKQKINYVHSSLCDVIIMG